MRKKIFFRERHTKLFSIASFLMLQSRTISNIRNIRYCLNVIHTVSYLFFAQSGLTVPSFDSSCVWFSGNEYANEMVRRTVYT